jgi:hypothetical protein
LFEFDLSYIFSVSNFIIYGLSTFIDFAVLLIHAFFFCLFIFYILDFAVLETDLCIVEVYFDFFFFLAVCVCNSDLLELLFGISQFLEVSVPCFVECSLLFDLRFDLSLYFFFEFSGSCLFACTFQSTLVEYFLEVYCLLVCLLFSFFLFF